MKCQVDLDMGWAAATPYLTMLGDVVVSPIDAARRLHAAAVDGRREALAEAHGLSLVVMFGSASRGQSDARDLR